MEITYLGHAGFLVETKHAMVVMDPWLSPSGAFDSAWFQFPCNHHLAPFVREKLQDKRRDRYIYISHEHRDHFDPEFLASLPNSDFRFVVPHFHRDALRRHLAKHHSAPVASCGHGQEFAIRGGSLKLYLDDSGLNRDSGILVKADGETFLNLNDCKLYDEVPSIAAKEGPISAFTCQFSGATYHPTCYDYPREEYERISRHKQITKFEMVARAIQAVSPRVYLPSAGPACFLDPTLLDINFEAFNIFPRAPKFIQYVRDRLPDNEVLLPDIMPGDVISARDGSVSKTGCERVEDEDFEGYVRSYAERYGNYFADRYPRFSLQQTEFILEQLRAELQRKLSALTLHDRIAVPLYFLLSDYQGKVLEVDFAKRTVEVVPAIDETRSYHSVRAPSWQVARVLDGSITWEEFALTFRMRLNRKPDLYQTLIQGFLLMEPEDMNFFCGRLLEIEKRRNRTIIEAGGTRYSIDRLCPHQGGDLSQGWLDGGRLWTCPRHRWQFALDKNGLCTSSDATIHAVCLECD
jgi:UDP-MurNAc hydroxylase